MRPVTGSMLVSPRVARIVGNTQMTPQYTESLMPVETKKIHAKTDALNHSVEQDFVRQRTRVNLAQRKTTSYKNEQGTL